MKVRFENLQGRRALNYFRNSQTDFRNYNGFSWKISKALWENEKDFFARKLSCTKNNLSIYWTVACRPSIFMWKSCQLIKQINGNFINKYVAFSYSFHSKPKILKYYNMQSQFVSESWFIMCQFCGFQTTRN